MKHLLTATILLSMSAWAALAQTAAPAPAPAGTQTPTFKAGGEEVVLDVVVRDKKGRLVKDLKASDFTVTDNGEKHPVKSFRLVEGTEAVGASGARTQLDPLRQIRLVTLIFQGLDQDGRRLARQAGLDLLKTEFGQNVFMSVLTIDHRLQAIQTFTNDRDLLRKAIERATGGANDFTNDTLAVRAQLQQLVGTFQGGNTSLDSQVAGMNNGSSSQSGQNAAPNGSSAANMAMANLMLQIVNSEQQDAATDYGRAVIFAILDAVKDQYRLPGRKTILLFSSGFSIPQGMEQPFDNVISIANRSNVSFYAIDARGLTTYSTNQSALDNLNGAVSASAANIASNRVVTTDMAKAEDRSLEAGRSDTQNTLGRLAHETGGELIANTNDFRGPLRKLNEDIQTYYELTYDPDIQKYDGSFRKIAVKTDEADLRVQTRAGYFALPPNLTKGGQVVAPYEVPILKALDEKPVPHTFAFHSTGMHFRDAAGAPACEVVLDVPIGDLTLQEDKASNQFEGKFAYVMLVKNQQGEIVKKLSREVPLKIDSAQAEAFKAQSHFVSAEPFDLPPGRYTLDAGVADLQGEKISARKSSFMVPGGAGLSISSVAIVRDMKPVNTTTSATDPLRMKEQIITPNVNPVIKKSAAAGLPFYVVIYPDKTKTDKPELKMEFSRDGQVLGAAPAPLSDPDADGRIQDVVTAPLANLEPGNYQVRFVARQGTESAVESATFTLEP